MGPDVRQDLRVRMGHRFETGATRASWRLPVPGVWPFLSQVTLSTIELSRDLGLADGAFQKRFSLINTPRDADATSYRDRLLTHRPVRSNPSPRE